MESEIRNRKNLNKINGKDKNKKNKKVANSESLDLISDEDKLKKISRDSGDGDSAPDTPPPECSDKAVEPNHFPKSPKAASNGSVTAAGKASEKIADASTGLSLNIDVISVFLFIISFATRIWRLDTPRAIVFDELHYGKYTGLYMQNTFFFDSQPPLGKLILAGVAYLTGYNSEFKFDRIGGEYDAEVPVAALRLAPAFFGSLLMPTIYHLMLELGVSPYSGVLAALLLIFDNAVLIQTRYVLMEGFLLFFGVFGLLCILRFRKYYKRPYSLPWFTYLILGAMSLTACVCVRYFGLFTFCLGLGILIRDFWSMVGDKKVSDLQLLFHCVSRSAIFVFIPVAIYVGVFAVHLKLLYKAGPNDNIMTSSFQASLEGGLAAIVANQPLKVLHGSQITLRHTHGRTCWLHSHDTVYPVKYADDRGSSHQQQVTCYSYKDVNNWWIVKRPDVEELVVSEPQDPIKHGEVVQLVHGLTSRALNSHDVAAAMSPHSQEVACYIDYNVSMPAQNLWRVEILNRESSDDFWYAVDSNVRLIHLNTSSGLKFSGRQLPDWGFRQHEVVADRVVDQEDTVWNVEEHRYSRTEDKKQRELDLMNQEMIPVERRNLTFWDKLHELQYKMLFNNQENVAGHMYASEPVDWPLLQRGVAYWVSPSSNAQVHFLGNIVSWLSGTVAIVVYVVLFVVYLLRRQRACYDLPEDVWNKFCTVGEVLLLGYAVNYFPYFLVDRTLFLHHYMPAYIFKMCTLAALVDHGYFICSKWIKSRVLSFMYVSIVCTWLAAVMYVFYRFLPVTYGHVDLTADDITALTWRSTWDFIVHKQ